MNSSLVHLWNLFSAALTTVVLSTLPSWIVLAEICCCWKDHTQIKKWHFPFPEARKTQELSLPKCTVSFCQVKCHGSGMLQRCWGGSQEYQGVLCASTEPQLCFSTSELLKLLTHGISRCWHTLLVPRSQSLTITQHLLWYAQPSARLKLILSASCV